jgi:putative endopeptidase
LTIDFFLAGMPDRDYYFDKDKEEKREKYLQYVTIMFSLLGSVGGIGAYDTVAKCETAALAVVALETSLAQSHLTRTDSRDPERTYNKMSVPNLSVLTQPELTWASYLATGNPPKGIDWTRYFRLELEL